MRILIGLPTPETVSSNFSLKNLPEIIADAKQRYKDIELFVMYKTGVMTSSNRNYIVSHALENDMDAILWLDTDMIYPADIIYALWEAQKDIIGSIYVKRSPPYDPIVYVKGDNPNKPYRVVDPYSLKGITEVDGLGFGGLMVRMNVYREMAEKNIWHRYGEAFGFPYEQPKQESHDFIFCQDAQKLGYKIYVHNRVRCGHITEKMVTLDDWIPNGAVLHNAKKIAVLMPSIDVEKAERTIKQMQSRASFLAEYFILEDKARSGYMATINQGVKNIEADYYIYTAEDAYCGKNWLYHAYYELQKTDKNFLAFNDGKNEGKLATFGMISKEYLQKHYGGNLFFEGYHSHYGDTELTMLALADNELAYNPHALMIEVDYNKKKVNQLDKIMYNQRTVNLKINYHS